EGCVMPGPLVPGMTALRRSAGGLRRSRERRRFGVGGNVTRLILTTYDSSSGNLGEVYRDAIMVVLGPHFIGGPLPTETELEALLAMRSDQKKGDHWLDYVGRKRRLEWVDGKNLGLVELCDKCEQVELWIDPRPKDQLRLVWLLDYVRHHERVASKL